MTMTYIKYILSCEICNGPVAWNGDTDLQHIEIAKSYSLMADTATVIEKDHEPYIEEINGHIIIQDD